MMMTKNSDESPSMVLKKWWYKLCLLGWVY